MALNLFIMGLNFALSFLAVNVKNETSYQWALFKKQLFIKYILISDNKI